nr:hypothetical protein Iba_scaffold1681459CG0010 [Ipomoea batatas]
MRKSCSLLILVWLQGGVILQQAHMLNMINVLMFSEGQYVMQVCMLILEGLEAEEMI